MSVSGSVPKGHFVVVFHFSSESTHAQRGEAIHDLFLRVKTMTEEHPHVADADIAIPGDPLDYLFPKP
jgi:hypothetical protein